MNRFRWVGLCAAIVGLGAGCVCAAGGEGKLSKEGTVVIPLDQIWAHNMPGTKPIRAGRPRDEAPESPLLREIRWKLLPKREDVGLGFAVEGAADMTALRNAHAVFVDGAAHTKRFAADSDVTIVFFSKNFGRAVRLSKVTRKGTNVMLFYRFIPLQSLGHADAFALVLLGKIHQGTYRVEMRELPMHEKYRKQGYHPLAPEIKKGVVSESFSFVVVGPESK